MPSMLSPTATRPCSPVAAGCAARASACQRRRPGSPWTCSTTTCWRAAGRATRPRPRSGTLEEAAARFYQTAAGDLGVCLPERARLVLTRMAGGDWLASYRDLANVRLALEGIRRRLSARAAAACPLPLAADVFAAEPAPFEADFEAFWPELAAHAAQMRAEHGSQPEN